MSLGLTRVPLCASIVKVTLYECRYKKFAGFQVDILDMLIEKTEPGIWLTDNIFSHAFSRDSAICTYLLFIIGFTWLDFPSVSDVLRLFRIWPKLMWDEGDSTESD